MPSTDPANPYPREQRNGKRQALHRWTAEHRLGRKLKPGEVIHHKNGNKEDYAGDNLMVFSSHSAHMMYEQYHLRGARRFALWDFDYLFKLYGHYLIDLAK